MSQKISYLIILVVILVGAGCSQTVTTNVSDISASPSTNIEAGTQIALYVTAVGKNLT